MLERASRSPATDYHLCLLDYSDSRVDCLEYFTSDPITALFQQQPSKVEESTSTSELMGDLVELEPDVKQEDINSSNGQSGVDFLRSIAGMFSSEPSNVSENVENVVSEFIIKKHGNSKNDVSD